MVDMDDNTALGGAAMTVDEIQSAASSLLAGRWSRTSRDWRLNLEQAYKIQDEAFCQRLERGERVAGFALTPVPVPQNTTPVVTSWLTDRLLNTVGLANAPELLTACSVTAELGFVTSRRITEVPLSPKLALSFVDRVHAALHVRYDVDITPEGDGAVPAVLNGATAFVCLDSMSTDVTGMDLQLEACVVELDGRVVQYGTGAALFGHEPANALAAAITSVLSRGHIIEPGWLILTGGLTPPVPATPGITVSARFTRLGSLSVQIADSGRPVP